MTQASNDHNIFLSTYKLDLHLIPSFYILKGGVEVFLRVREAKTKKHAILWTPNVTVVPASVWDATFSWFA
jgi:hypothetical protein